MVCHASVSCSTGLWSHCLLQFPNSQKLDEDVHCETSFRGDSLTCFGWEGEGGSALFGFFTPPAAAGTLAVDLYILTKQCAIVYSSPFFPLLLTFPLFTSLLPLHEIAPNHFFTNPTPLLTGGSVFTSTSPFHQE